MKIKSEDAILDIEVRKQVISEINGNENKIRKDTAYKRSQIYKDQTYRYVIDLLMKQFEMDTVHEMQFSLANISIMKKIVNKLARVYSNGCNREIKNSTKDDNDRLHNLENILEVNSVMKNTNRILKYQRNVAFQILPTKYYNKFGAEKNKIKIKPLAPYLYDVIENDEDHTKPLVYILSDYKKDSTEKYSLVDAGIEGRSINTTYKPFSGDNKDQLIADTPEDSDRDKQKENERYVFWSKSYHFISNGYGEIITENIDNPIEELPFVNFSIDQDGYFWAEGGDDLSIGSVLINSMLTNINYVGIMQGYGQFWMKGKNVPAKIKMSPKTVIRLEYNEGEPVPDLGFVSSNPPLNDLMQVVETYIALLLTTNNLSTSGVATELTGGAGFPSGVALMIDKAESMEDVNDQRQIFIDGERDIWKKIAKWMHVLSSNNVLDEELEENMIPEDSEFNISFPDSNTILTEKEKLENIELRKSLGINTMVDLLMMDNPELTYEEAEEKLLKIQEQKANNVLKTMSNMMSSKNNNDDQNKQNDNNNDNSNRSSDIVRSGDNNNYDTTDSNVPENNKE